MTWEIVTADCTTWLPEQARYGLQVDAVVTDPPYHLASIQKRFGKAGSAPAQHGRDGAAARLSKGFMGSPTDQGDIAFRPETWQAIATVMKPGARLAAFGGARTWWKLAAAIDAAGFEIEDTLMWVYGQGLVLRRSRLKPCVEPIILARAPGPVLDLNIEECRIPSAEGRYRSGEPSQNRRYTNNGATNFAATPGPRGGDPTGHWPGNLLLEDLPEVDACFPNAPGQQGDLIGHAKNRPTKSCFFTRCAITEEEQRIIYCAKAPSRDRMCHCTICSEHFRGDRRGEHQHGQETWEHITGHPTIKPQGVLEHLTRLICPPGGLALDPFCGSASGIEAAVRYGRSALGIEIDAGHAESSRVRMRTLGSNWAWRQVPK